MVRFKSGDRVRQIKSGYGTDRYDNGKEAIVVSVNHKYLGPNDGIIINRIGNWHQNYQRVIGGDAFILVSNGEWNNKNNG